MKLNTQNKLSFNDFLIEIDNEIQKSKTKKQKDNIIKLLIEYKNIIPIENEIYKQSSIDLINNLINKIENL